MFLLSLPWTHPINEGVGGGGPKHLGDTPIMPHNYKKKCTASFKIPFPSFFYGCEVLSRWHWSLAAGDIVFLKHEALIHITAILEEITTF